mmetsp:Transcript_3388/g.8773  ORF Transcript_3388/g.8773 Transcript_3388/m.8773 type:complete len:373 (-) Transcript_3388:82-1200(-)
MSQGHGLGVHIASDLQCFPDSAVTFQARLLFHPILEGRFVYEEIGAAGHEGEFLRRPAVSAVRHPSEPPSGAGAGAGAGGRGGGGSVHHRRVRMGAVRHGDGHQRRHSQISTQTFDHPGGGSATGEGLPAIDGEVRILHARIDARVLREEMMHRRGSDEDERIVVVVAAMVVVVASDGGVIVGGSGGGVVGGRGKIAQERPRPFPLGQQPHQPEVMIGVRVRDPRRLYSPQPPRESKGASPFSGCTASTDIPPSFFLRAAVVVFLSVALLVIVIVVVFVFPRPEQLTGRTLPDVEHEGVPVLRTQIHPRNVPFLAGEGRAGPGEEELGQSSARGGGGIAAARGTFFGGASASAVHVVVAAAADINVFAVVLC